WWLMKPDPSHTGTGRLLWGSWALGAAVLHAALWMSAECIGYLATARGTRAGGAGTATTTRPVAARPLWYTALRVGACGFGAGLVGGLLLSLVAHALGSCPPACFPL